MSCTLTHLIHHIASLTGLAVGQITMAVDAVRQRPSDDVPEPASDIVDAVLRQQDGHDRAAVTAALRQLLAALIRLRNQGRADVHRLDPLLATLTATPPSGIAPAIPAVAAIIRARLGVFTPDDPPPAPLPTVLPPIPAEQQRAVRAAARLAPWTDEEARRIVDIPRLAGLAWALGVDHPLIRNAVAQSLDAAVAAVCAGFADPVLIDRVVRDPTIRPELAAQVIATYRDLATPQLLAKVAQYPYAAALVIVAHRDLATPDLLDRVAQQAWPAARVIIAHRDLATPQLLDAVAQEPNAAAAVIIAHRDLATPQLRDAVARDATAAADVIATHRNLATSQLLDAAAQEAWAAVRVIIACPDLATPQLLDAVLCSRHTLYAVADACGPFPALWQRLTKRQQGDILRRYRCTPAERAWIAALTTRTPPAWTTADDTMAARFRWHDALRNILLGAAGRLRRDDAPAE